MGIRADEIPDFLAKKRHHRKDLLRVYPPAPGSAGAILFRLVALAASELLPGRRRLDQGTRRVFEAARPALTRVWRELVLLVGKASMVHEIHPSDAIALAIFLPEGIRTVRLQRGAMVIGRAACVDVRVEGPAISREHAVLYVPELEIEDNGSTNGTYVEGHALPAWRRQPLQVGQTVEIGCASLMLVGIACQACVRLQMLLAEKRRLGALEGNGRWGPLH